MNDLTSLEVCAGAGGQALGLHQAGFSHEMLVELDEDACRTLARNSRKISTGRANWNVLQGDLRGFDPSPYEGVDLYAGGVPCPPFSVAGKQLGHEDERDLFPTALDHVERLKPRAVLLENVRGLSESKFSVYRKAILARLESLGYLVHWKLIYASDHGLPQLRPRFVLVALQEEYDPFFVWPTGFGQTPTVGQLLYELMAANGWPGAAAWRDRANGIGPTLVGGSKKHGGADLGPSRAREAWRKLGVKASSIAAEAPSSTTPVDELPRLTLRMTARLQGFPDWWEFEGKKTSQYRQIGNAFPPPVARALGSSIRAALMRSPEAKAAREAQLPADDERQQFSPDSLATVR